LLYSTYIYTGLEKVHRFVKQRGCRVRFDLWNFEGRHKYAEYRYG